MESKKQIQQIGNESQKTTNYDYDIFVSYRHLSSDSKIHSASLARSITQAFQLEGFKVFFYCNNTKDAFEIIENTKSRYYIILVTQYSIDTVKNYHYKTIEEKESINESKEGDGYNFAKELYLIDKGIASNKIDKRNVFLFNIDKCFERRRDIPETFSDCGYKLLGSQKPQRTEVINFPTDEDFSIDKLINPDPDKDGEIKIEKSPRYSYERCKELYETIKKSYDSSRRTYRFVLILMSCVLLGTLAALLVQHNELSRFKRESIIFAGGGTVQRYIDSVYQDSGVNIKHYKLNPGSKYIHLPSTAAWQLLWDDVNEGEPRQYCPIVLSTSKIKAEGANIEEFEKNNRKIVEYPIDSIPLKVQVFDNKKNNGRITIDSLKKILNDTINYEIWTTTKESGTYLEYKELLNDTNSISMFDLDALVEKQSGGRKYFNPKKLIGNSNENKTKILLANEHYYYELKKSASNFTIISDTISQKQKINLYVYTVGYAKTNSDGTSTDELVIRPEAIRFLNSIGCDTDDREAITSNKIIVTMNKRKQQ